MFQVSRLVDHFLVEALVEDIQVEALMEDILERAGATAVAQWAKTDPQTLARGKHKEFFQKVTLLAAVDTAPDTAKRTQTPRKL